MKSLLEDALVAARPTVSSGRVADYIPALTKADPSHLGVSVATIDGQIFSAGEADVTFTIQSISKVFALALVMKSSGPDVVFQKVGVEPSGNPFYSLVQLECESGKPRNPFINAGAIAVCGLLPGDDSTARTQGLLDWLSSMTYCRSRINTEVYESERSTGSRNNAVGYFMKHFGILSGDVNVAVDTYFKNCSIEMTCEELARAALFLTNGGKDPASGKVWLEAESANRINALMTMCGLYDASGDFACRVGVPGKSGVGGGILAVVPGKMSIAAFGPALNEKGNSIGATKILEHLSAAMNLSLYR